MAKPMPLKGKRVLSFETWGSGAFNGALLAMLGAEVINIEDPRQGGNPLRHMGQYYVDEAKSINEGNLCSMHNKKSVALDIREKPGKDAFHKLVAVADAVIDNFRGTLSGELGVTYNDLAPYNPRIVCVHLSAYGRDNERASWPGYDFLMQAETGWMSITGDPGTIPTKVGCSVVDLMGGMYGALCAVAGLLRAETTGLGGDADTNLFDAALNSLAYQALWFLNEGALAAKQPRSAHASQAPSQLVKTQDGWVYVACLTQKFWELLCDTIQHQELKQDERFTDNNRRFLHRDELTKILDDVFSEHPTQYWKDRLEGIIPFSPVYDVAQALENRFLQDSGRIVSVPYAEKTNEEKDVLLVAPPFKFPESEQIPFDLGARYGQHTREMLEIAGLSAEEIEALVKWKVAVCGD